jgi:hypothetical protein
MTEFHALISRRLTIGIVASVLLTITNLSAATLAGSFASIPRNSEVNLSTAGPIDWVHWGLFTATSANRKAGITPRISDFTAVSDSGNSNAYVFVYRYADNYNGYSWTDGDPAIAVTNTTTGVWAYGIPTFGTGFEFTVPADTTTRTLKVYVGAFAARGTFDASLSDGSANSYSNSSLVNMVGNGPSGTYTITYAAASAGQTLRVRWTLLMGFRPDANVTLQAAALSAAGANNPPTVALTSPGPEAQFSAPASIALTAAAADFDGSVTRVEFYANNEKLGEDNTSTYSFDWNNVAPGLYSLKALAYDNGGEVSESPAVEVFVYGTGGSLLGGTAFPPASVNLTTEGTADWIHWGRATNSLFNRKATASPQLSDFVKIGSNTVERYADNYSGFSWTDGMPDPSASGSHTGVFLIGTGQGFALTLPADSATRTVKLYVGLYGAKGSFQAYLGDFSSAAYQDESLENVFGSSYAVYTLTYSAPAAGGTLHIRYRAKQLYDGDYGNVTLQAVTLAGGSTIPNTPPTVTLNSPTNDTRFVAPGSIPFEATANDPDGAVVRVEFFQGANKLGEDTTSPYHYSWNNVPPGTYTLTARATDNFGAATTSAVVAIVVETAPVAATLFDPRWVADGFAFSFSSQAETTYEVQVTDAPGSGNWQFLQTLIGNGSILSVTNLNPSTSDKFYRVESK